MISLDRTTKLRLRRKLRRRQKQVETAATAAESHFDRNFVGRLEKLRTVRRFVITWLTLLTLATGITVIQTVGLGAFYQKSGPIDGGTYNEGMVGTFSNANPLFASGPVDTSLSRLMFAGLLKYDETNSLTGDLAETCTPDESGKTYTVRLKKNLVWHDGKPLTAQDVVFTYALIQNPDVRSPLLPSWQGIQVSAPDSQTVVFRLPNALTAFPYGLTTGIVPKHILSDVPAAKLRAHVFNTSEPVGAGPFLWETLQVGGGLASGTATTLVSLKPFQGYNGGKPRLDSFVLHTYENEEQLLTAYRKRSIQAVAGIKNIPADLEKDASSRIYNFTTTAAMMVFFKTNTGVLSDVAVRRALVLGAYRRDIIRQLGFDVKPVWSPFLIGQSGYDKSLEQARYNPEAAKKTLDDAGWKLAKDGIRAKDGKRLEFMLFAEDTPDNAIITKGLQKNWRTLGVSMNPVLQPTVDFRPTLETHEYEALLYGIAIGTDPDVFVYWHSSQADIRSANRLNFSEYKSTVADSALESARTRQDVAIRTVKYKPFLKAWQEDAPAIGLYQPNTLYVTRGTIHGLNAHTINTDADRYYSIQHWQIKTGKVPK